MRLGVVGAIEGFLNSGYVGLVVLVLSVLAATATFVLPIIFARGRRRKHEEPKDGDGE